MRVLLKKVHGMYPEGGKRVGNPKLLKAHPAVIKSSSQAQQVHSRVTALSVLQETLYGSSMWRFCSLGRGEGDRSDRVSLSGSAAAPWCNGWVAGILLGSLAAHISKEVFPTGLPGLSWTVLPVGVRINNSFFFVCLGCRWPELRDRAAFSQVAVGGAQGDNVILGVLVNIQVRLETLQATVLFQEFSLMWSIIYCSWLVDLQLKLGLNACCTLCLPVWL